MYIGESENVFKRLSQQDKNQDFWNEVVAFTSKDEHLTKAHIKYLESKVTGMGLEAGRYQIKNANTPTESNLPRADKDAMEEFVNNLKLVLGTLGHRVLEPIKVVSQPGVGADTPKLTQIEFEFSIKGLKARGQQTDDGFVLFKDSDVSATQTSSMPEKVAELRKKWIADGSIATHAEGFRLTKDKLLSSSSYAAALVAGTRRSGPQSFKDAQGRTLKVVEEALLEEAQS